MRLWSLHPSYLDTKGLLAVWREGLLAQKVLEGKTKGYKNHPQLDRFKKHPSPKTAIGNYLLEIWKEASARGYSFTRSKVHKTGRINPIPVTRGQMKYELEHLRKKLRKRDHLKLKTISRISRPKEHPLFKGVAGAIENWERF